MCLGLGGGPTWSLSWAGACWEPSTESTGVERARGRVERVERGERGEGRGRVERGEGGEGREGYSLRNLQVTLHTYIHVG